MYATISIVYAAKYGDVRKIKLVHGVPLFLVALSLRFSSTFDTSASVIGVAELNGAGGRVSSGTTSAEPVSPDVSVLARRRRAIGFRMRARMTTIPSRMTTRRYDI